MESTLAEGDKIFPEILEGFRESLHEWQDAQAGFAEIHRVLQSPEPAEGKPGGVLALEDLNRASPR